MSIGDMAQAAAARDVLREVRAENEQMRGLGAALLSQIDALMPYIEKAIGDAWDKGDYINGPQFGAAIEAFREALAQADRNPEGHDPAEGHGRNDECRVAATSGDAPKPYHSNYSPPSRG